VTHVPATDDSTLERYVLGLLPPDEAERLDEASVADDETAARLRRVEENLIDRYVRRTLDGGTLDRFESHYLASSRRRQRVRLAEAFIAAVDRAAGQMDGDRGRSRPAATNRNNVTRMPVRTSRPIAVRLVWAMSLAAATVFAIVSVVFVMTRGQTGEVGELVSAVPPSERPVPAVEPLRAADPPPDAIVRGPDTSTERARPSGPSVRSGKPPSAPIEIALVLAPPTRASDAIPELARPAADRAVGFELQIEPGDFAQYQVALKDPVSRRVLWRSEWIAPQRDAQPGSIRVAVPAGIIGPQRYWFELAGRRDSDGPADIVGSYVFQATRP
jgi:hypothetical protein